MADYENSLKRDNYRSPMNLIDLQDSQNVDGTLASAVSTRLNAQTIRITATDGDIRFKIGDKTVEATVDDIFLGDHDKEFIAVTPGQYIAVLGGPANIVTCGAIPNRVRTRE